MGKPSAVGVAGGFQAVLVGWRGALPRTRFWVIGGGVRGEATYPTDAGYGLLRKFGVQAAFLGCRVGIYAHAVSGCLRA